MVPFEETWAAITSRRWPSPSAFNAAHNQEEDLSVAGAQCHSDAELADDDAIPATFAVMMEGGAPLEDLDALNVLCVHGACHRK